MDSAWSFTHGSAMPTVHFFPLFGGLTFPLVLPEVQKDCSALCVVVGVGPLVDVAEATHRLRHLYPIDVSPDVNLEK